jgi:hypothetical protein
MNSTSVLLNRKHRRTARALALDPVEMFDTVAAAIYVGGADSPLSQKTLENWRCSGRGPRFYRVGGRIRYSKSDLDAWLDERRRSSTSETT